MTATQPGLTSIVEYAQLVTELRADQRHIIASIQELKQTVASVTSALNALTVQAQGYATLPALQNVSERLGADIDALADRTDHLERRYDIASGGLRYLYLALALIFTTVNIAVASKGKLW